MELNPLLNQVTRLERVQGPCPDESGSIACQARILHCNQTMHKPVHLTSFQARTCPEKKRCRQSLMSAPLHIIGRPDLSEGGGRAV